MARFQREARAAARLKSVHVVKSHDVGMLPNGVRYLVMEYLQGEDLAAFISRQGPLRTAVAVEFLLHICDALAEAHRAGIVHRDLKPENLFIIPQPDGTVLVKVLDFGISKTMTSHSELDVGLTRTSCMMGTPFYAAPEQLASAADVDERADIWALGVVLYEMLTGSPPFSGCSLQEVVTNVVSSPPPSLRQVRPDVSEDLERVVVTCLEKRREARFAGIGELVQALLDANLGCLDPATRLLADRILRLHGDRSGAVPGHEQGDRCASNPPLAFGYGGPGGRNAAPGRLVQLVDPTAASRPEDERPTRPSRLGSCGPYTVTPAVMVVASGPPSMERTRVSAADTRSSAPTSRRRGRTVMRGLGAAVLTSALLAGGIGTILRIRDRVPARSVAPIASRAPYAYPMSARVPCQGRASCTRAATVTPAGPSASSSPVGSTLPIVSELGQPAGLVVIQPIGSSGYASRSLRARTMAANPGPMEAGASQGSRPGTAALGILASPAGAAPSHSPQGTETASPSAEEDGLSDFGPRR